MLYVNTGKVGAAVFVPFQSEQHLAIKTQDDPMKKNQALNTVAHDTWNRHSISLEVKQSIRSLAKVSTDLDHSASLMDVGLDSLATDELSSMLHAHFDIELPAAIVFGHPTTAD